MTKQTVILAAGLVLIACIPQRLCAQSDRDDIEYFEQLRSRRLWIVARTLCQQQVEKPERTRRQNADWIVRSLRIDAERALHADPTQRDQLWEAARETAGQAIQANRDHPYLLLVRAQDVLTILARAEALRQEAEVSADREALLESARSVLREADRSLETLRKDVRTAADAARRSPKQDQLSADELFSMENHLQFQQARVLLNRALCYPPESNDRLAALSIASQRLREPLPRIASTDPLRWDMLLADSQCSRLLNQIRAAERVLAQIPDDASVPAKARLGRRAEALRLDGLQQRWNLPASRTRVGQRLDGVMSADLEVSILEYLLAKAAATNHSGLYDEAAQAVDSIEKLHGPYWGRRAELLLVRAVGEKAPTANVNILRRRADDLFRKGALVDAIAAYRLAAAAAQQDKSDALAFELSYKAGLILQQQKKLVAAAEQFQDLSLEFRGDARAAAAHLSAAWNMYLAARDDADLVDRYALLLDEQVSVWPKSEATDQARMWLGSLLSLRRQWKDAAVTYLDVGKSSEHFAAAIQQSGFCWDRHFVAQEQAGPIDLDEIQETLDLLTARFPADGEPWTDGARNAVLAAARLRLRYTADGFAESKQWLAEALAGDEETDVWRNDARALLVTALAGSGDVQSAAEEIQAAAHGSSDGVLSMVESLESIASTNSTLAESMAQLSLKALEQLAARNQNLTDVQRKRLAVSRARALAAIPSQQDAAAQQFAQLAAAYRTDGQLQRDYGRWLARQTDKKYQQLALTQWRKIAAASRPKTESWFEARYEVASVLVRLGNRDDARQRIKYLQATAGFGPDPWPERFAKLLRQTD